MQRLIIISAFALLSCGQNNTKDKDKEIAAKKDSVTASIDSSKKTGLTITTPKDSLVLTNVPDETRVNELLRSRPGRKWHVLTDKQAAWDKQDFEYYLTAGRKKDPNYPFIIKGDFNGDNKMDYAALVTNDKIYYDALVTRVAILPAEGSIVLIDENSFNKTVLTAVPKSSLIEGYDGPTGANKKVKLKVDAIDVNNHDGGGYYIYWNGTEFKFLYSEG